MVDAQIAEQARRDVLVIEAIAIPLSFMVLSRCSAACSRPRCRSQLAEYRFLARSRYCA